MDNKQLASGNRELESYFKSEAPWDLQEVVRQQITGYAGKLWLFNCPAALARG
jgi:hypothetical protein